MEAFDRLVNGITAVVKTVMVAMTFVIFFVTIFTVFTRYILNFVPSWSEEVPRYLLVWITYLGAALAVKYKEHISLDVFFNLLPVRMRQIGHLFLNGLVAIVGLIMLYYGIGLLGQFGDDLMESIPVRNLYLYLAMPISGALMLLYLFQDTWKAIRGLGQVQDVESSDMVPI